MQSVPREVIVSHLLPLLTVSDSVHLLFVLGETAVLKDHCVRDVRHFYDKKLWFLQLMCDEARNASDLLQSYLYWTEIFEKTWPIISQLPSPPNDRPQTWAWRCLQEEVESELSHDLNTIHRLIRTRWKTPPATIYCTA